VKETINKVAFSRAVLYVDCTNQHAIKKVRDEVPKNVILSIKPEYALQIMEGKKTIELRRRFPVEDIIGGIAIIYASSPLQGIIGYAQIQSVTKLPLAAIWEKFSKEACVTKKFFDTYFNGLSEGFAITLSQPVKLKKPVSIQKLEKSYSFTAPQSYQYATEEILEAVEV
jgi:predicted transcriptional regulator